MTLQLPLAVGLLEDANLENFNKQGNEFIVTLIEKMIEKNSTHESLIYLIGCEGMGKSHLLQAAVKAACKENLQAVYLPMKELINYSVDIFDELENSFLICIDDLHLIAGDIKWEKALFEFYNRCYDSGATLFVSATMPYNNLNFCLPDLQSRFACGLSHQIKELSDESKINILEQKAVNRGLVMSLDAINFLLKNYSRSICKLVEVLDLLDEASLSAKQKITLPFVKKVIALES